MTIVLKRTPVPLWQRLFPFMGWLPKVNRQTIRADLVAGITVALVAIPQSLAYAQLAGVPPYHGLYASFLPVIIGALWGSSQALSTGPVAMTSLLTAASVMTLAKFGTDQFYAYVILIYAYVILMALATRQGERRQVVPGSHEARLFTRRARSAPEGKQSEHPNAASSHLRALSCAAIPAGRSARQRTQGGRGHNDSRRSSRFWRPGCPGIFHEIEDPLDGRQAC